MKAEHINAVIKSFKSTFKNAVNTDLVIKNSSLYNNKTEYSGIFISVGVTGQIRGQIMMNISEKSCRDFAESMMGSVVDDWDVCKSAAGEIVNMSLGKLSTLFAEMEVVTDITPPIIYEGTKITMSVEYKKTLEIKAEPGINLIISLQE